MLPLYTSYAVDDYRGGSIRLVVNLTTDQLTTLGYDLQTGASNEHLTTLLSSISLALFNLIVVVGNFIVIMAVCAHRKLRRATTNKFIISLAVADLMVGLIVLPFSSTNQVMMRWPFGQVWCRMWLAIDVWLCTASILNLCAISLDRYIAISRPFRYSSIMTPLRARLLIVSVWILAFVICCPPLIAWTGREGPSVERNETLNSTPTLEGVWSGGGGGAFRFADYSGFSGQQGDEEQCLLNSEPGYIIYSACGSFWVPMLVMEVFYWKIYKTAVSATNSFRRGFIECHVPPATGNGQGKGEGSPRGRKSYSTVPNSKSENAIALRVHRGSRNAMPGNFTRHSNGCISELVPLTAGVARTRRSLEDRARSSAPDVVEPNAQTTPKTPNQSKLNTQLPKIIITSTSSSNEEWKEAAEEARRKKSSSSVDAVVMGNGWRKGSAGSGVTDSDELASDKQRSSLISLKLSKMNIIAQLRNFNKEKRAAKTVGVIVGCFIICWTPFFTVYLVGAFCRNCTPTRLFHVFFWLGYCNSALNPFLYALCSKEFRYAFKKLLRCRVEQRHRRAVDTRGNAGVFGRLHSFRIQIASKHEESLDVDEVLAAAGGGDILLSERQALQARKLK